MTPSHLKEPVPADIDLIIEAITSQWGDRCDDFEPSCACCRVWRAFDHLLGERDRCAAIADRYGKFDPDTTYGLGYQTTALNIGAPIRKGGI
ncbi:hypothetical protein [Rhizobium lusitanum]|uniref:Uncharacterized protein n=1 Tax=Rhizobium lusitanum TaxID=293958 RepID=A0A1C3VS64_9HYPH|nr:hypothetical protein [Rhizobium lusitanum]SCB30539.1 hypothetical protein GA0061101_106122 [Rhizobium lusitanum]